MNIREVSSLSGRSVKSFQSLPFLFLKAHLLIHSLSGVFCLYLLHRNYVIVSLILLVLIPYLAAVILTYGFMCPVSAIKPFRLSN